MNNINGIKDQYINIEELQKNLVTKKGNIVRFLKKHFFENIDYYIVTEINNKNKRGGRNKKNFLITQKTYELTKNTYGLRNNKNFKIENTEIKYINRIMNLEASTIGFIYDCFHKNVNIKKQYKIDNYFIDLYFIDHKIAIECDEFNHNDRDAEYEKNRENKIIEILKCSFIRFDPRDENFKLSDIISDLIKIINKT
jgi:very-short-patch-repair endonuclease